MNNYYKPIAITEYIYDDNKLLILIEKDDYAKCLIESSNRWSNTKTGSYGSGAINTSNDPHKAERIGLLGEMAFAKLLNLSVDCNFRQYGDTCDFIINNKSIDVKTSSSNNQINYIKTGTLKNNIYVFCSLIEEEKNTNAIISINGWQKHSNIKKLPHKISPINSIEKWYNYEIHDNFLLPINNLYDGLY